MPVPSQIKKGETVEIRFQFTPNDRYLLENTVFRLYYTSTCADQQTIDLFVEDSFGQVEKVTFNFTNHNKE